MEQESIVTVRPVCSSLKGAPADILNDSKWQKGMHIFVRSLHFKTTWPVEIMRDLGSVEN